MRMLDLLEPKVHHGMVERSESLSLKAWERNPNDTRAREIQRLQDIDEAHSFNKPKMLGLFEEINTASPLTPEVTMDPHWTRGGLDVAPEDASEQPEDIERSLDAIQRQLDLLTQTMGKKSAWRGNEGDQDPNAVDTLLAHGLRALLRKTMLLYGPNKFPSVLVKFDGLTFKAKEDTGTIATNGSRLMRLLFFWRRIQKSEKLILDDVSSSFRPSCTCLVLGPPRSGKSALMKAIAGRLEESHGATLQGVVDYAGLRLREKPQPKGGVKLVRLVGYVPPLAEHIPTLTVRETVNFAWNCVSFRSPKIIMQEGLDEVAHRQLCAISRLDPEVTLSLLGIHHVGDTLVGSDLRRGISSGQRRQLTTAEVLVTHPPVLLMDGISTGLDSAAAFEVCAALRSLARCQKKTVVVSLLQPTPEMYSTFDEVMVMVAGQIAYHGPREGVLPYFLELGFQVPKGKDVAEFLQDVTLPEGIQKYRALNVSPRMLIHRPEDFGPAWRSSHHFQKRLEEDEYLYHQSSFELSGLPADSFIHHRLTSNYTQSGCRSTWLCLKRQTVLTVRNVAMIKSRI
eukprot:EG_transcript_8064